MGPINPSHDDWDEPRRRHRKRYSLYNDTSTDGFSTYIIQVLKDVSKRIIAVIKKY